MTHPIDLPDSVDRAVRAMCEDYERRADAIAGGALSPGLHANYMLLNEAIDHALAECCEENIRADMRHDIATGTGYRATRLYYMTPRSYLTRKKRSKLAIARALHLL